MGIDHLAKQIAGQALHKAKAKAEREDSVAIDRQATHWLSMNVPRWHTGQHHP